MGRSKQQGPVPQARGYFLRRVDCLGMWQYGDYGIKGIWVAT